MPRAAQVVPVEQAVGKRAAVMCAQVIDAEELTVHVHEHDKPVVDLD
jgi:hypothetical protein